MFKADPKRHPSCPHLMLLPRAASLAPLGAEGWPRLLYAVWLLYAVCCIIQQPKRYARAAVWPPYSSIQQLFLLYCCMVCCMERLAVWHVWYVCGPHLGQLTHSMVVIHACMRPTINFRPTRTPITPWQGLYGRHTSPYISLMYGRHTSAIHQLF